MIAAVVPRLENSIRHTDLVARLGGDEFAILLDELAGERDGVPIAQRIVDALSEPFQVSVGPVRVTASLGLAVSDDPHADPQLLVSHADAAMYRGKQHGGGRVEVFDEAAYASRVATQRLEAELRDAADAGQLSLAYQPIVDLTSRAPIGVEALLRWNHPQRGRLAGGEFIDVAEHSGQIVGIAGGSWPRPAPNSPPGTAT